jgi:hypothetical protein
MIFATCRWLVALILAPAYNAIRPTGFWVGITIQQGWLASIKREIT